MGHRRVITIAACTAAACVLSAVLVVVAHGQAGHVSSLMQAPVWVRQQEAGKVKMGLVDELQRKEKQDQANIASIQQVCYMSTHTYMYVSFVCVCIYVCMSTNGEKSKTWLPSLLFSTCVAQLPRIHACTQASIHL